MMYLVLDSISKWCIYWIIYFFSNDGVFISDVTSSVIALLILLMKEMVQFP